MRYTFPEVLWLRAPENPVETQKVPLSYVL